MILNEPIKSLTLAMATNCNLQCEYCLLNKSKNEDSINIQKKTILALQDGTYLNNVLQVLKKLSSSPNHIENLEFWGQEPTLFLNYFTDKAQNWLDKFPNIKRITFSTNGTTHSKDIVIFLKTIDSLAQKNIKISIQFSYDEVYSNSNCRHADSNSITNNIKYIIHELNDISLKNIKIYFNFHAVISNKLIHNLQTLNDVNNYCQDLFEWPKQFILLNKNQNLNINDYIDFGLEAPIEASQEDGIKFANFCKLIHKSQYNLTHNKIVSKQLQDFLINGTDRLFSNFYSNKAELLECLKNIKNDNILNDYLSIGRGFCGTNYSDLKIMYNGTLVGCQNQIFDTNIDFINTQDKFLYSIKKDQVTHKRIINPLTASEKELQLYFYTYVVLRKHNFKILYNNIINFIYILAKFNQIDNDFLYDENKLLIYAYYIAKYNNCHYNAIIKTGNSFFKHLGVIRFFCNGALTEIMSGDY